MDSFFDGIVTFEGGKFPEAGVLEVEFQAPSGKFDDDADAPRLVKGERLVRKLADYQRHLVSVSGVFDLPFAHIIGETFIGNDNEQASWRVQLQFAVGKDSSALLLRLALREGLDGHLLLVPRQLPLDLGGTKGGAALRKIMAEVADA